jgi:hypothetical protein
MRRSLLLIGTAYLTLGLGSAQACAVQFRCMWGGGDSSEPCQFDLQWPDHHFSYEGGDGEPTLEDVPPNAKYCARTTQSMDFPLSKCLKPIWPDGKCFGVTYIDLLGLHYPDKSTPVCPPDKNEPNEPNPDPRPPKQNTPVPH